MFIKESEPKMESDLKDAKILGGLLKHLNSELLTAARGLADRYSGEGNEHRKGCEKELKLIIDMDREIAVVERAIALLNMSASA
jgi:hypothetical protein